MKNTLCALAVCAVLASCNEGSGDAVIRKKVIDSMTNEFNTGHIRMQHKPNLASNGQMLQTYGSFAVQADTTRLPDTNSIVPSLQDTSTLQAGVNLWGNTIRNDNNFIQDTASSAFILPLNNFIYMKDFQFCEYVVFYLMINNKNMISLAYAGAQQYQNKDSLIIQLPSFKGVPQAFDNTIPCPECPMQGLAGGRVKINPDSTKPINHRFK